MKKKIIVAMLALSLTMGSSAYASEDKAEEVKTEEAGEEAKEEKAEEDSAKEAPRRLIEDEELEKYVTLGEYKGMPLERVAIVVTDEMLESRIQTELEGKLETEQDAEAEVAEGDIANINYVGTKDGEAFDGGSADNFDLTIGSGMFIAGFEDGVIGMKKGETKDLSLTFPEEYPAADLAGQEVIFTVTLNAIKRVPELSDEWVEKNSDYKTVEEYKKGLSDELEQEMRSTQENSLLSTAFNTLIESSEIKEYPEAEIQKEMASFDEQVNQMIEQSGTDRESFLESQGMTEEEYQEQSRQYAEYRMKQILVIQAIMDAEGLSFEGEETEALKAEMVQMMGATSFDDITALYGESDAYNSLGAQLIAKYIVDHAEMKEEDGAEAEDGLVTEEETEESEEAAEEEAES